MSEAKIDDKLRHTQTTIQPELLEMCESIPQGITDTLYSVIVDLVVYTPYMSRSKTAEHIQERCSMLMLLGARGWTRALKTLCVTPSNPNRNPMESIAHLRRSLDVRYLSKIFCAGLWGPQGEKRAEKCGPLVTLPISSHRLNPPNRAHSEVWALLDGSVHHRGA